MVDGFCRQAEFSYLLGRFGEAAGALDRCGHWVDHEEGQATAEYVLVLRAVVRPAEVTILQVDYPPSWDRNPWWRPRWPRSESAHPVSAPWARAALRAALDRTEAAAPAAALVPEVRP